MTVDISSSDEEINQPKPEVKKLDELHPTVKENLDPLKMIMNQKEQIILAKRAKKKLDKLNDNFN